MKEKQASPPDFQEISRVYQRPSAVLFRLGATSILSVYSPTEMDLEDYDDVGNLGD